MESRSAVRSMEGRYRGKRSGRTPPQRWFESSRPWRDPHHWGSPRPGAARAAGPVHSGKPVL